MPTTGDDGRPCAAVLTPPGRGAVASVVVFGDGATAMVERRFTAASGKTLAAAPLHQIVFGRWGGAAGEELVVCRRRDEEIEIHCHGGQAAVSAVLASLAELGCREIPWTEWSRRQAGDLIAAEAVEALSRAATLRSAAILLDQYHGALRRELDHCATLLEAADEAAWQTAYERLQALRDRGRLGRHLIEPFRVVLAGPPNVGKSSLINALVGYQRSIVYDQPGTTRDVVGVRTAIAGWPVELSDTAGLRPTGDPLEADGVRRAQERLAAAELAVLVFDASQRWSEADAELLAQWPQAIVVYNKSDLAAFGAERPPGITTIAITGAGIDQLLQVIGDRLASPPPPGCAVPFTAPHEQLLAEALELFTAGSPANAARRLREFRRPPPASN